MKIYRKKVSFVNGRVVTAEQIPGGRADSMSVEDIADKHGVPVEDIEEQIRMGKEVEMEHVNDKKLAEEIAKDHLTEFPDYYTELNKMESKLKKKWGK